MPTNEERREVAENLRSMCACGCKYAEEFYGLLMDTVMDEWDFHSFGEVADRLADLIDPEPVRTCHVVPMDDAGNPPYRKGCIICNSISDGCSECGCPFDTANRGVPNYCSNCGAKVVE